MFANRRYTEEFKGGQAGIVDGGNAAAKRLGVPQSTMNTPLRISSSGSPVAMVPGLHLPAQNRTYYVLLIRTDHVLSTVLLTAG
jgi:hypothetical protein